MKKSNIPALLLAAAVTLVALVAALVLLAPLPAQAAEKSNERVLNAASDPLPVPARSAGKPHASAPSGAVVYTIKQFTEDGKSLGEWKTRFERPTRLGSCVEWRVKRDGPANEICGGILQVTAEDEELLTHQ